MRRERERRTIFLSLRDEKKSGQRNRVMRETREKRERQGACTNHVLERLVRSFVRSRSRSRSRCHWGRWWVPAARKNENEKKKKEKKKKIMMMKELFPCAFFLSLSLSVSLLFSIEVNHQLYVLENDSFPRLIVFRLI